MSISLINCIKTSVTIALSVTFVAATTVPTEAFWPFSKKNSAESKRKKRNLHGTQIGLVPGNPPALYWEAKKPKAVILCLHELGLYSGVFDNLGQRMADKNISVYAIDLRGFGGWREMEKKNAKMDLAKTLADVKGSCEEIRKLNKDIPVFILGEAMGGALALQAASKYPTLINGIISAAPGGDHFKSVNNFVNVGVGMAVGSKHAFGLGEKLMDVATPKQALKEALSDDEMVRMDVTANEMVACQFFMYKTKAMAKELGPKKIRVNTIAPGATLTEGIANLGLPEEFATQMIAGTPLGRIGMPEDIAKVAVFLASDDSAWVTGERLTVAGGYK